MAAPTIQQTINISQTDITNLTQDTTINVTTNRTGSGDLRKLQNIKQILKKSAEAQLLVAAYYNKLIKETESNPSLYADGVTYENYTVSVNTSTSSTNILSLTLDISNAAFATFPLVISYKQQVERIDDRIATEAAAATTGGILNDGNTYDGGRPSLFLKSKKKKKKTSIKRR